MTKRIFKIAAESINNTAVIRIDGVISFQDNQNFEFKTQIDALVESGITEVVIYINSGGGSCFDANEIVNEVKKFTGKKTAKLGGLCASAATYIACKCDMVYAAKNTNYMIHKPVMSVEDNSDKIKAKLKLLEIVQSDYANAYSNKTGLKHTDIANMWLKDYWMNAEQAKDFGFVDIIEGECELTLEDINEVKAMGYKNLPNLTATFQSEIDFLSPKVFKALSLPETSNKLDVITALEKLKKEVSKVDEMEGKIRLAESEIESLSSAPLNHSIEGVLKKAKVEKKITFTNEEFFKKRLEANYEETKAVIESFPSPIRLSSVIKNSGDTENKVNWTYEDYQNKDPKALKELSENNKELYKTLFKQHYGEDLEP